MKSINLIFILSLISLSFSLFSMELNDDIANVVEPKNIIKIDRPKRTPEINRNLGEMGQFPDDVIINIALQIIEDSKTPKEAFDNLTNLARTNKYINSLLEAVITEPNFRSKINSILFKIDLLNIEKAKKEIEASGYVPQEENIAISLVAIYWLKNILPTYKDKENLIQIINSQMQTILQSNDKNPNKIKILLKMAQMIIDSGFDINKSSSSLLEDAFINDNYPLAQLLLDNKANIDESVQSYLAVSARAKKFIEDYQKNVKLESQLGKLRLNN